MTITWGECGHPLHLGSCRLCDLEWAAGRRAREIAKPHVVQTFKVTAVSGGNHVDIAPRSLGSANLGSANLGSANLVSVDFADVSSFVEGQSIDFYDGWDELRAERERWRGREDEANAVGPSPGRSTGLGDLDRHTVRRFATDPDDRLIDYLIHRGSMRLSPVRMGADFVEVPEVAFGAVNEIVFEVGATIARICPPSSRTSPMPTGHTFQGMQVFTDLLLAPGSATLVPGRARGFYNRKANRRSGSNDLKGITGL